MRVLLLVASLLAGCADVAMHECGPGVATALVTFETEDSPDATLDALAALGWTLRPGERDGVFDGALDADGARYEMHGVVEGPDGTPTFRLLLRAPARTAGTDEAAREVLAPAAEPLLARFGGEVEYRGAQLCA